MRGAERDGRGEVRAHSHRQESEAIASRDLDREGEMRRGWFTGRRDAHQAGERQAMTLATGLEELIRRLRLDAGLLRLAAGVHLDQESRPLTLSGDLLGQRLAQAWPIDRMNGVEQRDRV